MAEKLILAETGQRTKFDQHLGLIFANLDQLGAHVQFFSYFEGATLQKKEAPGKVSATKHES